MRTAPRAPRTGVLSAGVLSAVVLSAVVLSVGVVLGAAVPARATAMTPVAAPETPNLNLAVGGQSALIYLPLTVAARLGYFTDAGLKVEISDFNGGSKALQALVGGSADVVAGVYEHTLRMQSAGRHLEAFVVMANSMQLALAVAAPQAGRIRQVADLKGARIGVSAPGSTTHLMVDRVLAGAHLDSHDVSIIGVGIGASAVSAVASGQIDAICTPEPAVTLMQHKGLIRVLVDARTAAGTLQVFGGAVPTSVLYAEAGFVRANPRTIQALTDAIIRADRWIARAAAAEVARVVPESFHENDTLIYIEAFEKVRDGFSADGRFLPDGAANTLRALAAFDPRIRAAAIDLPATYTDRFALDFARRQR
jgi:NitT/TauT family transport system substrate-binding protein